VEALKTFGENIGMAFQMVDDALDCAPEEATGKPTGGDLREGKLTPPLQMYRNALDATSRASFDKAFEQGTFTQANVDAICATVRERGYDAKTREAAEGYLSLARTALDAVPDAKERGILLQMADYVRDRKK
jgi:octaprenyl-diphosphate synthase